MLYIQILSFIVYFAYINGLLRIPLFKTITKPRDMNHNIKNETLYVNPELENDEWIDGELPWVFNDSYQSNTVHKMIVFMI